MKTITLDKSRSYGEIIGQHFVGRVQVSYEQDGMMFDSEGQSIASDKAAAKAEPAPVIEAKKAKKAEMKPVEEAVVVIDEPTIGVDLKSYAKGNAKAPWHMVVKAVTDAYGVTPANKDEAIKIIQDGKVSK